MFSFTPQQLFELLDVARRAAYEDGLEDGYALCTVDIANDMLRQPVIDVEFTVVDTSELCD